MSKNLTPALTPLPHTRVLSVAWKLAVFILALSGLLSLADDAWNEIKATKDASPELGAASYPSPAHGFLVRGWLDCSILVPRNTCYGGIQAAAEAHGEEFAKQVEAAAIEMRLI